MSFDGTYTDSLTLDQARLPDVIGGAAHARRAGHPHHGGPVRLYAAPMYGYKSMKWLVRHPAHRRVEPGYWEGCGYSIDGFVGESNGPSDEPTGYHQPDGRTSCSASPARYARSMGGPVR